MKRQSNKKIINERTIKYKCLNEKKSKLNVQIKKQRYTNEQRQKEKKKIKEKQFCLLFTKLALLNLTYPNLT